MTVDELDAFLSASGPTQREKLKLLEGEWKADLAALADADLLRALHAIRKAINSKKLKGPCNLLIGELRRDGRTGGDALPALPRPAPALERGDETPPVLAGTAIGLHNLALEASLLANSRDRDTELVYRDWLEEHGLVEDGRIVLGPLANLADMLTEVQWERGFIRAARLASNLTRFNGPRQEDIRVEDALGWLLDDPGPGRLIDSLVIGLVRPDDNHYQGVCEVLGRLPRPSLRSLHLGDFGYEECELNWSTIDAHALWPGMPRLEELTLRSGGFQLGDILLPELRRFELLTGGLDAEAARNIASAHWPKLESLSLQFGPARAGEATDDPEVVQPILDAVGLPALRHLGITNCDFTDAICERLVDSKILPQLQTLDLSMGTMSATGASILLQHRSHFAHLRELDLDDNYLPDTTREALSTLGTLIHFGTQRNDGGDPTRRYASAYE